MEREIKETLQSIDDTLKRIETILLKIEMGHISAEDEYKKIGISQTFA